MTVSAFGHLSDGRPVQVVRLGSAEGLHAEVLTWGATLRSLSVPTPQGRVEVLLQLPTLADYEADTRYLNPVIGRCANRIGGAAFTLNGRDVHVTANEGANCLHGGSPGWNKRLWTLKAVDQTRCTLAYTSPDGESGFPGEVEAEVDFAVTEVDTLQITWRARTSAPTPINLTHHLYFNLSGRSDHSVLDDRLTVGGAFVTPVGDGLIPTGEIRPVEETPFDLREGPTLKQVLSEPDEQLQRAGGVDLNWVLTPGGVAARLACVNSGLALEISTDQPALQVYTGQGLNGPFHPHEALVLEPQGFPDAVNQPRFPAVVIRPDEPYQHSASYRLVAAG